MSCVTVEVLRFSLTLKSRLDCQALVQRAALIGTLFSNRHLEIPMLRSRRSIRKGVPSYKPAPPAWVKRQNTESERVPGFEPLLANERASLLEDGVMASTSKQEIPTQSLTVILPPFLVRWYQKLPKSMWRAAILLLVFSVFTPRLRKRPVSNSSNRVKLQLMSTQPRPSANMGQCRLTMWLRQSSVGEP